jgi:RNA polymerase sigma-70 factor (ECF subfamily)
LYGYLHRYLGNNALAEDVFQNTFLQLYLKSGQYEEGRPVRPWLYTIATHQAIDALRRNGRHQAVSLEMVREESSGQGDVNGLVQMLESRDSGPFDQLAEQEQREKVRASVEQLPEPYRQVLLLAYYQGLKYREIADILEIPVGTVKSRLHAALLKLQDAWNQSPSLYQEHRRHRPAWPCAPWPWSPRCAPGPYPRPLRPHGAPRRPGGGHAGPTSWPQPC